jgi:hypothetical protein
LCADEFTNELVCGFRAEIRDRSALNDPAFIHERNLVGQKSGFSQVMRNEQNGLLKSCANLLEIALEIHSNKGIKRREWLIEQKQFGRQHERAHQTHALALPTRELEGISVEAAAGKFRELAELHDAFLNLVATFPEQARLKREILPGGKMREETTVLDNITEPAANFHDCSSCDPLAVKLHFASVSNDESYDQAQNGRLAAAARTDQGGNLTTLNLEINFANGEIVSENFTDVAKVNESVHVLMKGQTCSRFAVRSVASPAGRRLQREKKKPE